MGAMLVGTNIRETNTISQVEPCITYIDESKIPTGIIALVDQSLAFLVTSHTAPEKRIYPMIYTMIPIDDLLVKNKIHPMMYNMIPIDNSLV